MNDKNCPKCHTPRSSGPECPRCGVIYAKADAAALSRAEATAKAEAKALAEKQKKSESESANKQAEEESRKANLQPCGTCGETIARSAKLCPHCGAKQKQSVGKPGLIIAGFFVLAMIIGIAQQPPHESSDDQVARVMREQPEVAAKATAELACTNHLKSRLRDPDSLVIDNMAQQVEKPDANGRINVFTLFEIRARNGFGGMNRESYICDADITGLTYKINRFSKSP